jgi:hypothetical protein
MEGKRDGRGRSRSGKRKEPRSGKRKKSRSETRKKVISGKRKEGRGGWKMAEESPVLGRRRKSWISNKKIES